MLDDSAAWFSHVRSSVDHGLTRHELAAALKATTVLHPDDVDALIESSWHVWTQGREELQGAESLEALAASIARYLPNKSSKDRPAPVDHWDDGSAKLEDGHTTSGAVCSCGQIHVRRGDRIRRGPMESEIDDQEISEGQLGTIVSIGIGQESVIVKWDRSREDSAHSYTWPDPEGLMLQPAKFAEVALDVSELQTYTGLSSVAADELLRQGLAKCSLGTRRDIEADLKNAITEQKLSEESLRKPPKQFHRARILPDKLLVQQWFDQVPPCKCSNASCSGGVQWSSRAAKHLGRESVVLKIDKDDDTVLVETQGPCNCQIWYPHQALQRVYDPDVFRTMEFEVDDHVECRMEKGWEKGVVTDVLWRGEERRGPVPYSVKLDTGVDISVPHFNLIRRVSAKA